MTTTQLRVYRGPESQTAAELAGNQPEADETVTLPAEEIIPLLADAYRNRRKWLRDFGDDSVTISADMYELLLAYRFFNRPSA